MKKNHRPPSSAGNPAAHRWSRPGEPPRRRGGGPARALPVLCLLAGLLSLGLAGCAGLSPPVESSPCPVCAPCPKCAEATAVPSPAQAALQPATFADLPGWPDDDPAAAWNGFLDSCSALAKRPAWPRWQGVCAAARALPAPDAATARLFFEQHFRVWALNAPDGQREGLITGYYEPILNGSRQPGERAKHPVLAVPDDLLTIELATLYPELKAMRLRGRLVGNKVLPYFARSEIVGGNGDRAKAKALAWVEDAVELFFMQIQGSGRIALTEGGQLRVGYADQNGHPYQSIGRVLVERGELKLEQASMQGIQAWARANPDKLDELLNTNPSFVFFRELPPGDHGPPGALGVPLTAGRSLAVDPRHIPLGAPVFLATTQPNSTAPLNRLLLAQDTGGAIKGVVRADLYFGGGPAAGQLAGRMKQKGRLWVLLPADESPEATPGR